MRRRNCAPSRIWAISSFPARSCGSFQGSIPFATVTLRKSKSGRACRAGWSSRQPIRCTGSWETRSHSESESAGPDHDHPATLPARSRGFRLPRRGSVPPAGRRARWPRGGCRSRAFRGAAIDLRFGGVRAMNGGAMTVGVYLRVSTEEQRERQSIATQREFAERYCQLHSLPVFRVYADDGVSGTVPLELRPEGSQILKNAVAGRFPQLLVYKLDRLGRETRLILNAVADLEKLGVRVRSMTEEFDTGTSTGRLMLTMLSGFASHERDVIRERSVAGTNRVAEAGAWLGGIVPFGYRKVGVKRDAQLVVSEGSIPGLAMSEAEVIREVFRRAAVEHKSCRAIADRLNSLHIPTAYVRRPLYGTRQTEGANVRCLALWPGSC